MMIHQLGFIILFFLTVSIMALVPRIPLDKSNGNLDLDIRSDRPLMSGPSPGGAGHSKSQAKKEAGELAVEDSESRPRRKRGRGVWPANTNAQLEGRDPDPYPGDTDTNHDPPPAVHRR